MGLNFPASPTVGQLYPSPATLGVAQYKWDGTTWKIATSTPSNFVTVDQDQSFSETQKAQGRKNIYAAPFDAMAYSGMQINGGFEVNQAGVNATLAAPVGAIIAPYFCDQWMIAGRGTFTVTGQTVDQRISAGNTFGGTNRMGLCSVGTAQASFGVNDVLYFMHPIEGWRFGKLNWGRPTASPITVSFLFFSVVGGTFSGAIRNGAVTRSYPFTFAVTASTVTYVTVTIPGDTTGTWDYTTGVGMYLTICLGSGTAMVGPANAWAAGGFVGATGTVNSIPSTSSAIYIGNVTVLPGTEAPSAARAPYIMRPYDQELQSCLRYYEKGNQRLTYYGGTGIAGIGTAYDTLPFLVQKRIVPAMSVVTGFQYYSTADAFSNFTPTLQPKVECLTYYGNTLTNWKAWTNVGAWAADARL